MCKFLLVEDHPIVTIGLSNIIKKGFKNSELQVVASFADMQHLLEINTYQLVIVGLSIDEPKETKKILDILKHFNEIQMLVFSNNIESLPVKKLYYAGVKGILDKQSGVEEIQKALQCACDGNTYISQKLRYCIFSPNVEVKNQIGKLTSREYLIAKLLIEGKSNVQICKILELKPSTVSTFKNNIFIKLRVSNLLELSKIAETVSI